MGGAGAGISKDGWPWPQGHVNYPSDSQIKLDWPILGFEVNRRIAEGFGSWLDQCHNANEASLRISSDHRSTPDFHPSVERADIPVAALT